MLNQNFLLTKKDLFASTDVRLFPDIHLVYLCTYLLIITELVRVGSDSTPPCISNFERLINDFVEQYESHHISKSL